MYWHECTGLRRKKSLKRKRRSKRRRRNWNTSKRGIRISHSSTDKIELRPINICVAPRDLSGSEWWVHSTGREWRNTVVTPRLSISQDTAFITSHITTRHTKSPVLTLPVMPRLLWGVRAECPEWEKTLKVYILIRRHDNAWLSHVSHRGINIDTVSPSTLYLPSYQSERIKYKTMHCASSSESRLHFTRNKNKGQITMSCLPFISQ